MSVQHKRLFFNTTVPCHPGKHYMIPPEDRLMGAQLDRYIHDELYRVFHAPCQTGKTTFLQRVLNGGGHIERNCAAGRGRMDLRIDYEKHRYIIEIKLPRSYHSPETFRKKGLEQVLKYRDMFDAKVPTYLIIFDRRPNLNRNHGRNVSLGNTKEM